MNCPRETEIVRAIEARHWPERCDEELRAHAASCADCADLVDVATALTEDREETMHAAQLPPSGAVWYRAQLRVRQDAARSVRRVISVVQAAAVLIALVAVFVIARPGIPIMNWNWAMNWTLPIILALASPLLLAPLAVYIAVTED
jgi:predicted anti-sigma-YlaC factor YlaD